MAACSTSNTKSADGSAPQDEPPHRGVRNPRVIDLITPIADSVKSFSGADALSGSGANAPTGVELLMIEDRPWGSEPAQLDELQEKLNNYLDYVLDGFLVQQYPAYAGLKIRIALECVAEPKGAEQGLLEAIERYLASTGIGFRLAITGARP